MSGHQGIPDGSDDRLVSAAERQYRRLLDSSLAPICVHDGELILYVNPVGVRALGAAAAAQIVGRPITEFIHPHSAAAMGERLAPLQADGDVSPPMELTVIRLDGSTASTVSVATLTTWGEQRRYEVIFRARPGDSTREPSRCEAVAADVVKDAIIQVDAKGAVTDWTPQAQAIYGRSRDEAMGTPVSQAVGAMLDAPAIAAAGGIARATHCSADGAALTVRVAVITVPEGYVLVCADETAVQSPQRYLHTVLDCIQESVVILDSDGCFEFTNAAARRLLGGRAEELAGNHHSDQAVDLPLFDEQGHAITPEANPIKWIRQTSLTLSGEVVGIDRTDGRRAWVIGKGALLDPDDPVHSKMMLTFTDITEHYQARLRLHHDATHDWLTGLPNRTHALERAAAALNPDRPDQLGAVMFIDLDNLKTINDSHGHLAGDDVLRVAARRMRSALRATDLLARIGGDEFVALLHEPISTTEIDTLAQRLHGALHEPITLGSAVLRISASIGITAIGSDDPRGATEALGDADAAMYRAKAKGPGNTAHFSRQRG